MSLIELCDLILQNLTNSLTTEIVFGIEAAFLAILMPLTIFMIQSDSERTPRWERVLIIRNIIKGPNQLFAIFLGSIVALSTSMQNHSSQITSGLFLIAVLVQFSALIRAYKWLNAFENETANSFRQKTREKFLNNLADHEKLDFWSDVFSSRTPTVLIEQRQLLKTFYSSVIKLNSDSRKQAALIAEFNSALDRIHLYDYQIYESFINFLKQTIKLDHNYENYDFELNRVTEDLLQNLARKSISNNYLIYFFIKEMEYWLDSLNLKLKKKLFGIVAPVLLESFAENNRFDLQDQLPKNWLITSENLEKGIGGIADLMFNEYLDWISPRSLYSYSEKLNWDRGAEIATSTLFPTSDVFVLTDFLIFQWAPWGVLKDESSIHAKIRNFIENEKPFGHISHITFGWESEENHSDHKIDSYCEVAKIITLKKGAFPDLSRIDYLETLIDEINQSNFIFDTEKNVKLENFKAKIEFLRDYIEISNSNKI